MRNRSAATLAAVLTLAACSGPRAPIEHPDLSRLAAPVVEALAAARAATEATNVDAETYGRLGMLYQAHQFFAAAAQCYARAGDLAPADARWHYLAGFIAQEQGHLGLAAKSYRSALRSSDDDHVTGLRLVQTLLADNRPDEAAQVLDKLGAAPRNRAALHALKGGLATAQQRPRDAIREYTEALRLQPQARRLHHPLAMAWRAVGDVAQAERHLARRGEGDVIIRDPLLEAVYALSRSAQFHLQRGQAQIQARDYQAAVRSFQAAVAIAPDDAAAQATLGRGLQSLGDFAGAEGALDRALELDPAHAVANYFKGALRERAADDELAAAHYAAALRTDPSYAPPRRLLANAALRAANYAEAAAHFERLLGADEDNIGLIYRLGIAQAAAGNCPAALAAFRRARMLDPNSGSAMQGLARTLAICAADDAGRSEALELGALLVNASRSPTTLATLAMAQAASGDFAAAVSTQKAALAAATGARAELRDNLSRYESGRRAARAWAPEDPLLSPRRLGADKVE